MTVYFCSGIVQIAELLVTIKRIEVKYEYICFVWIKSKFIKILCCIEFFITRREE